MCDNDLFQLSFSHMIVSTHLRSCVRMKVEKNHYHTCLCKRQNDIAVCEPCARKGIKSLDSQEYLFDHNLDNDILVNLGILSLSSHMVRKPRCHFDAYCCSGEAGTGKTTFAQKLCAYVRLCGKIALGVPVTWSIISQE